MFIPPQKQEKNFFPQNSGRFSNSVPPLKRGGGRRNHATVVQKMMVDSNVEQ